MLRFAKFLEMSGFIRQAAVPSMEVEEENQPGTSGEPSQVCAVERAD